MNARKTFLFRGARLFALTAASGATMVMPMPALAELSPALDRISISVGAFSADPTFIFSLDSQWGNLQSSKMGLGKETMPRIKADIMIFDSQGISFDYYQYQRDYAGATAHSTNVFGSVLSTATNANLGFKFDYAKLAYKWWFGSGNSVLGLGAGAAYYKVDLNANASLSINNNTAGLDFGYSDDAVAPLLEVAARHAISTDLRLFANASGVKKSDGRLKGEISNAAVGVEWFPIKNVGVVLDYSINQIDLTREDTISVNINTKIQGPSVFVKVRF
jgi:hypothetical protein